MRLTEIVNLKTNYECAPLGIEITNVHFSWQMFSKRTGAKQVSYQIIIKENNLIVWDSGTVICSKSVAIPCPVTLKHRTEYEWFVVVTDECGYQITSKRTTFETGVTNDPVWQKAPFVGLESISEIAPVILSPDIKIKKLRKARLYITAMGVYQVAINGHLIKSQEMQPFLNPGYGNGDIHLSYQTYDLTSILKESQVFHCTIGLGNGWAFGMWETKGRPIVKALVVIEDDNGEQLFFANPKSWKASLEGAVRKNGIYYGEDYDANYYSLETFFQVRSNVKMEKLTTSTYSGQIFSQNGLRGYALLTQKRTPVFIEQYERLQSELKIKNRLEGEQSFLLTEGQVAVLDFGQNQTAIPVIAFQAEKGTKLTIRFSEILNDGRKWNQESYSTAGDGPLGFPYFKNLRQARASVCLTASGKSVEKYQPSYSFFGYRYIIIEVTNKTEILRIHSLPISSVQNQIGQLDTNNLAVNQLISNTRFSQQSNYFTTATDCPQRDERLFWSGDTQVFAKTAMYNFDSIPFLTDIQKNMGVNTLDKGYTPMVVNEVNDEYFSSFSAGWSDALIVVAWELYRQTGNVKLLSQHYDAFSRYFDFLESNERQKDAAPLFGEKNCGDWLSYQGTSVAMMGDYYYAYVVDILRQIAHELGKSSEEAMFSSKYCSIKKQFYQNHVVYSNQRFTLKSGDTTYEKHQFFGQGIGKKGGVWEDNSQTALLWFLKLGFYKDNRMREQVIEQLIANIRNKTPEFDSIRATQAENTLAIGFLGVNILAPILTDYGAADIAYDLLLQTKSPSWLYAVEAGATTIWERWNSYDQKLGFGDSEMNSFNHYAYGAIVEWLYSYVLGIDILQVGEGFNRILLQPTLDQGEKYNEQERICSVKGTYDSLYGQIKVAWQSENKWLKKYSVTLPANTTAQLFLPIGPLQTLLNERDFPQIEKVKHLGKSCLKIVLEAGEWEFIF